MCVVVTGGSGFIGSAVVREAVGAGHRVIALIRESEPALGIAGVESRIVDWHDRRALTALLGALSPDLIVHCAGSSARGQESAADLYDANVALVWTLLAAVARACPACGVVILSSAAIYGPAPEVPTLETAHPAPVGHYGHSKVLAEEVARAFAATDGVRAVVARPFNVLGPGEPAGSVVARIAGQLAADGIATEVEVRLREVASVRDFVDVEDVARALLLLGVSGRPGAAYNVCSGTGVSIRELVERGALALGRTVTLVAEQEGLASSVSIGNPERLEDLGWTPRVTLEESMQRIVLSMLPNTGAAQPAGR